MGFAPTWLRQVSPLLHMTTLATVSERDTDILLSVRSQTLKFLNNVYTSPIRIPQCCISQAEISFY